MTMSCVSDLRHGSIHAHTSYHRGVWTNVNFSVPRAGGPRSLMLIPARSGRESRVGFFGALYNGTGTGVMSTGTGLPEFVARVRMNGQTPVCYNSVRTTTTTTRRLTPRVIARTSALSFHVKPKRLASLVVAARVGAAGGTSSARRRRERRLRSWAKHEQLSVAAAPTAAPHHSAGRGVVTRGEEQQEGEVHEENDAPRSQATPLSGVRPGVPSDAGPPWVEAVAVGAHTHHHHHQPFHSQVAQFWVIFCETHVDDLHGG